MWKNIFIMGIVVLLICMRLLMTSNGKMATHKQIPPTPPQTIVLQAPAYCNQVANEIFPNKIEIKNLFRP